VEGGRRHGKAWAAGRYQPDSVRWSPAGRPPGRFEPGAGNRGGFAGTPTSPTPKLSEPSPNMTTKEPKSAVIYTGAGTQPR